MTKLCYLILPLFRKKKGHMNACISPSRDVRFLDLNFRDEVSESFSQLQRESLNFSE